ncbi:hypothetical protein PoB_004366400 [Plakobranchus ocellatus]|uniref:Uncharacterized protein n=1 Tax=Plakobranchus ocellatus TaxID=259542 RepID=A0AAV4BFM3_9GAST|nr:hypothetical protein PoB_004366400 [Plakobranchus ocellatus]
MFMGPELVVRRRERMRAVATEDDSIEDIGKFFTLKPTPCTLCFSGPFPCQKRASASDFASFGCCPLWEMFNHACMLSVRSHVIPSLPLDEE